MSCWVFDISPVASIARAGSGNILSIVRHPVMGHYREILSDLTSMLSSDIEDGNTD